MAASLPDDIFYVIFSLLPSKTLCRFQCVCKKFSSLIKKLFYRSSKIPRLLTQRLPRTSVKSTLFFSTYTYDTNEGFTLSKNIIKNVRKGYPWRASRSMPIQSCLGLVCIPSNEIIQLFNPSTEELIALPPSHVSARCIAPAVTCIGFGYALASINESKITGIFKVMRISNGDREIFCQILVLGTNDWRAPRSPPPYHVNPGRVPFIRGALHLLPLDADHTPDNHYIAAFNVRSECYKRIPLPKSYYEESHYNKSLDTRHLTELGGSLCFYRTVFIGSYMCYLEIWLLKNYAAKEWVRGCNIYLDSLPDPQWMRSVEPIAIMGDGSILVCVYGSTHSQLLCYNPESRIFTRS